MQSNYDTGTGGTVPAVVTNNDATTHNGSHGIATRYIFGANLLRWHWPLLPGSETT